MSKVVPLMPARGGACISDAALQPADIIISTTSALQSAVIRVDTLSPVSHAALYAGNSYVIEAIGEGVVMRTLSEALADDTFAMALRVKDLTPQQASTVIAIAKSHLGEKYNLGGAIDAGGRTGAGAGLRQLLLIFTAGISEGLLSTWSSLGYNKVYCSQLVLDAFWRAGVPIATVPSMSTPNDIVTTYTYSDRLAYVGHLKP